MEENSKTMVDKLKDAICTAGYVIGSAVGGAEAAISQSDVSGGSVGSERHVESKSMLRALLKGEVTKETQELAYRTYLVNREADRYEKAKKSHVDVSSIPREYFKDGKIRFTQCNSLKSVSMIESMKSASEKKNTDFDSVIQIVYESLGKVNLQRLSEKIVVDIDENNNKRDIEFHLDLTPYGEDAHRYRMAKNELVKCIANHRYCLSALGELKKVSFTTKDAEGELDDIDYTAVDPAYPKVESNGGDDMFKVTFRCGAIHRGDIVKKHYSESMAEKYANKEKKELTIGDVKDEFFCVDCGKEITRAEMEETMNELLENEITGMVLCASCRKKVIEEYAEIRKRISNANKLRKKLNETVG